MQIDPKDLTPMPPLAEFQKGGTFYLKVSDGDYARCVITDDDTATPEKAHLMRELTRKFYNEGRLFLNRNQKWKSFE